MRNIASRERYYSYLQKARPVPFLKFRVCASVSPFTGCCVDDTEILSLNNMLFTILVLCLSRPPNRVRNCYVIFGASITSNRRVVLYFLEMKCIDLAQ
jgi:hypothetical protein